MTNKELEEKIVELEKKMFALEKSLLELGVSVPSLISNTGVVFNNPPFSCTHDWVNDFCVICGTSKFVTPK